jgi:hypothetical protein
MIYRKPHVASPICLRVTIFQNPEGTLWTHGITAVAALLSGVAFLSFVFAPLRQHFTFPPTFLQHVFLKAHDPLLQIYCITDA